MLTAVEKKQYFNLRFLKKLATFLSDGVFAVE